MHRCSKCGLGSPFKGDITRHAASVVACTGATLVSTYYAVNEPVGTAPRRRQAAQPPPATAATGNHGTAITVGHAETVNIIIGTPAGDVVRAGSAAESDLIRQTILENADLRRMIRTIENAPAAIFNLTKGAAGPQALRNVRKDGRRVCELREDGVETSATLEYCKRTARQMVEELRRAVASAASSDTSPPALRQWAADVRRAMGETLCGDLNYVAALQLYCDASSRFYKLPRSSRDAIACGVRDIGRLVADSARF